MAKKLIHRFAIDVKYDGTIGGYPAWVLEARGFRLLAKERESYASQKQATEEAVDCCRWLFRNLGLPCQLVVHGKDGRIKSERGYPDETPKRKG